MKFLLLFMIVSQLCFGMITQADAACTVTHTQAIETGNINLTDVGQSFTATCDGEASSVTLYSLFNTSNNVTLSIYSGESVAAGDLLYTQAGITIASGTTVINLTAPVAVTSAQKYTFYLTGGTSPYGLKLMFGGVDNYPDGNAYYAGVWQAASTDFFFSVQIDDPAPRQPLSRHYPNWA